MEIPQRRQIQVQMVSKTAVSRRPTLLETLCRAFQWLEKTEDLDVEDSALEELKEAILLEIANLATEETIEQEAPKAA